MRTKKIYIILIVIVLVFFLVMFALFGVDNLRKEKYNTTLIVGNDTVWTYKRKRWINITNSTSRADLNWDKYKVFVSNEELGDYLLWYSDKWYAFDDNKKPIKIDGSLIAYKANYDMNIYKFTEEKIDDYRYVYDVLKENGLDVESKFTASYKVSLDFDNDESKEDFYLITNTFPMDFNPDKIFSIVFMVDDGNIYNIYTDISNNSGFNGCKPYFTSFIDVDNDKDLELILSCSQYSVSNRIDMLYKFDNNEFKIKISNQ